MHEKNHMVLSSYSIEPLSKTGSNIWTSIVLFQQTKLILHIAVLIEGSITQRARGERTLWYRSLILICALDRFLNRRNLEAGLKRLRFQTDQAAFRDTPLCGERRLWRCIDFYLGSYSRVYALLISFGGRSGIIRTGVDTLAADSEIDLGVCTTVSADENRYILLHNDPTSAISPANAQAVGILSGRK
jgi:hypothetical protein